MAEISKLLYILIYSSNKHFLRLYWTWGSASKDPKSDEIGSIPYAQYVGRASSNLTEQRDESINEERIPYDVSQRNDWLAESFLRIQIVNILGVSRSYRLLQLFNMATVVYTVLTKTFMNDSDCVSIKLYS